MKAVKTLIAVAVTALASSAALADINVGVSISLGVLESGRPGRGLPAGQIEDHSPLAPQVVEAHPRRGGGVKFEPDRRALLLRQIVGHIPGDPPLVALRTHDVPDLPPGEPVPPPREHLGRQFPSRKPHPFDVRRRQGVRGRVEEEYDRRAEDPGARASSPQGRG